MYMPKLNDTQLIILSAAAKNTDGLVLPLPTTLAANRAVIERQLRRLLTEGLIAEQPAQAGQEIWREDVDGQRLALAITQAGLAAIGAMPLEPAMAGVDAAAEAATSRSSTASERPRGNKRKGEAKASARRPAATKKPQKTVLKKPDEAPSGTSKQGTLIRLLSRKSGATIEEAVEATGWQPHSIRGAISGLLKKKLGLAVVTDKSGSRGHVYRIVD
jgi:hypothetical protein